MCHVVGLRAPPPGGGLKNTRTCAEHTILSRYTAHERVRTYAHTHPPFEEQRRKSCPFKSRSRPQQLLPDDSTRQSIPDPPPSTETPEALELEVQAEAADAVLAADRARAQQLLSKEPPGEPLALALAAARGGGEAAEADPPSTDAEQTGDAAVEMGLRSGVDTTLCGCSLASDAASLLSGFARPRERDTSNGESASLPWGSAAPPTVGACV